MTEVQPEQKQQHISYDWDDVLEWERQANEEHDRLVAEENKRQIKKAARIDEDANE
jgi:hypothetical protein